MSMVRFAQLCDKCGKRSPEYTPWAHCRECGADVCPDCSNENSEDETNKAICHECKAWIDGGGAA